MNFLTQCQLLPSFLTKKISSESIDIYFEALPLATRLTANILSDNAGYKKDVPFGHNTLLTTAQRVISDVHTDDSAINSVLAILGYVDFKFALLFFIQLSERYSYEVVVYKITELGYNTFLKRLNMFMSVFTAEVLCADDYDII